MSDWSKHPENKQIIFFFLGFLIFFVFSFSLGVIVGKQIPRTRDNGLDDVSKNIEIESSLRGDTIEGGQETSLSGQNETVNGDGVGTENREFPNENEKTSEDIRITEDVATGELRSQSTHSSSIEIDDKAAVPEAVHEEPTSSKTEDQHIGKTPETTNRRKEITSLPPIDPEGKYTIQIGSFLEAKTAAQILNSLKHKGFPAFVKKVEIPGYGVSYRVRIGTFGTRDKANLYGQNLKRLEPYIKSVYITMND